MIKIYSMTGCPDCEYVEEQVKGNANYEVINVGEHIRNLKAFLRLRDKEKAFDAIKRLGVGCVQSGWHGLLKGFHMGEKEKRRCGWCNLSNPLYVDYHDKEWGVPVHEDGKLFEMLLLESFQAGLSWECILNKREAFRRAFDGFDYRKIARYDERKLEDLSRDAGIVRRALSATA